jgi:hypothetical protein
VYSTAIVAPSVRGKKPKNFQHVDTVAPFEGCFFGVISGGFAEIAQFLEKSIGYLALAPG